ncbi:MAG: sulfotransferase domain-containing protein, partial [Acidobacteria bacterium]|nr:sulfotransferase domain-containing protein [Acidobacteriota bacterium]
MERQLLRFRHLGCAWRTIGVFFAGIRFAWADGCVDSQDAGELGVEAERLERVPWSSLFHATGNNAANLKILIVATPKTGNVWLKNLLALIYDLPQLDFPTELTEQTVGALGDKWVAHQHLQPSVEILDLLKQYGVTVVTIVRHPCDALVSLRHFVPHATDEWTHDVMAMEMLKDGDEIGDHTLNYVRQHFAVQLNLSLLWMRLGACAVHYENLLADPLQTLEGLTRILPPTQPWRIRAAVVLSDFHRMKRHNHGRSHHFRHGVSGEWTTELPPEIVEVFLTQEPYPTQFAALGYSLDIDRIPPKPFDAVQLDPFRGASSFDNGVPISEFVVQTYFEACGGDLTRWPNPCATASQESFFDWLNAPAEQDPRPGDRVLVTNLAHAIYKARSDLRELFPDV